MRKVSAIHFARSGSPGISTRSAICPRSAPMCVLMITPVLALVGALPPAGKQKAGAPPRNSAAARRPTGGGGGI
ncbi:hypothetical protein Athai_59180 [Actinocatenispora thailandica]|uniref:Uncharacterized protein n=1 Tax=Actinocatenispora thailandica TaxID=227318 RepID=A0A7R7DV35_9ACTN|nr:hypothetical protein Athai_59180 [Actinocatenispora thailandica]